MIEESTTPESLIGQYFHSLDDDNQIEWQGTVLAHLSADTYLVQLFEWILGEPSVRRIVSLDEMKTWLFYTDADDMAHSYERGAARKGGPHRRDK